MSGATEARVTYALKILALVILSVTLLANQRHLFSAAVLIAFAGAGIAVSGYFLN